jgi:hypothetical protein
MDKKEYFNYMNTLQENVSILSELDWSKTIGNLGVIGANPGQAMMNALNWHYRSQANKHRDVFDSAKKKLVDTYKSIKDKKGHVQHAIDNPDHVVFNGSHSLINSLGDGIVGGDHLRAAGSGWKGSISGWHGLTSKLDNMRNRRVELLGKVKAQANLYSSGGRVVPKDLATQIRQLSTPTKQEMQLDKLRRHALLNAVNSNPSVNAKYKEALNKVSLDPHMSSHLVMTHPDLIAQKRAYKSANNEYKDNISDLAKRYPTDLQSIQPAVSSAAGGIGNMVGNFIG